VVLAGFAGVVWRAQRAELADLRSELAALRASVEAGDPVVAALFGPEVHMVALSAAGDEPDARVFWNHTNNQFIVIAFDLPPAPPGRTYQLWAMPAGQAPLSMGTFETNAEGRGTAILPVSAEITAAGFIDACGMTLEPAGGSAQPTESPRLTGTWSHAD
jgi:anti-sigma-K factor RskA